jgi:Fumble
MAKVSRKDWKPIPVAHDHYQLYLHHPHTHSVPSNLNTLGDHHDDPHPGPSHLSCYSSRVFAPAVAHTRSSSFHDLLEPPQPLPSPSWDMVNMIVTIPLPQQRRRPHDDVSTSFYIISELGGTFHFIQFETQTHMADAMHLIPTLQMCISTIKEMGGTGGGAYKYAALLRDELAITMKKSKMNSTAYSRRDAIRPQHPVVGECYTYRPRHHDDDNDDHHPTTQKKRTTFWQTLW